MVEEAENPDKQTRAFAESLKTSGNYWILQINSPQWSDILAHYLYKYMPDEDADDGSSGAYYIKLDNVEYYYLAKEFVSTEILSGIVGYSPAMLDILEIIPLNLIPVWGDPDAEPNVPYVGTA